MLRLLQKLRTTTPPTTTTTTTPLLTRINFPSQPPSSSPSLPTSRFYTTTTPNVDPVALQMINYALGLTRSNKSPETYSQALLLLEQCLSSRMCETGDKNTNDNTTAVTLFSMSNILSERGDFNEAMEKLERIQDLENSFLGVRVAAMEGLVGLNLEMGQDIDSSNFANKCLQLVKDGGSGSGEIDVLKYRAQAAKVLVELVHGNIEEAERYLGGTQADKGFSGNVLLSHGEFLHANGDFVLAKEYYQKGIQGVQENEGFTDLNGLSTCNMVPAEVSVGLTCALGQLEAHSGNFKEAEEILTRALTKAEEHFGLRHPKVGVILACIALMFRRKARLERSSSILVLEGLYRKAIDLLKAPSLDTEESKVEKQDIVALARGGYAEILTVQQNRKTEGERLRNWAEAAWRNRRLSLAQALQISELPSKVAVVDTRISRAL